MPSYFEKSIGRERKLDDMSATTIGPSFAVEERIDGKAGNSTPSTVSLSNPMAFKARTTRRGSVLIRSFHRDVRSSCRLAGARGG